MNMEEGERWKDIEGYEGYYQISSLGRVKSLSRSVPHYKKGVQPIHEKILKKRIGKRGYYVSLLSSKKNKLAKIHRLIAAAFMPNPENKPFINHKNGIKTDNRIENLEWCTGSENVQHAFNIGLKKGMKGSKHPKANITEEQAKSIKYGHKGLNQLQIAKIYNISNVTVSHIRRGRTWTHI